MNRKKIGFVILVSRFCMEKLHAVEVHLQLHCIQNPQIHCKQFSSATIRLLSSKLFLAFYIEDGGERRESPAVNDPNLFMELSDESSGLAEKITEKKWIHHQKFTKLQIPNWRHCEKSQRIFQVFIIQRSPDAEDQSASDLNSRKKNCWKWVDSIFLGNFLDWKEFHVWSETFSDIFIHIHSLFTRKIREYQTEIVVKMKCLGWKDPPEALGFRLKSGWLHHHGNHLLASSLVQLQVTTRWLLIGPGWL